MINIKEFVFLQSKNVINSEDKWYRIIRFCIVGGINTVHYYFWYLLLLHFNLPVVVSHVTAFFISMVGSYFLNCKFTFRTKPTLIKFVKYPLTVTTNFFVSTITLLVFASILHINKYFAGPISMIFPIPFTFIVTKKVLSHSEQNEKKWSKDKWQKLFTFVLAFVLFFIISVGIHEVFWHNEYSMVGRGYDNLAQYLVYFPFLQKQFLSGNIFWSWQTGFGGDVFGVFGYYYTTSPFFLISVIVSKIAHITPTIYSAEKWFLILSIFKQTLSMFFMFVLLKYMRHKNYTSLIGAATYGASLFFIYFSVQDNNMTDPLVWVPLVVMGMFVFQRSKKPLIFIVFLAITIANSFYFGYMGLIMFACFIVIMSDYSGKTIGERIKKLLSYWGEMILFGAIALSMSAVAFIPSIIAYYNSERQSIKYAIPLLPKPETIISAPQSFFFCSAAAIGIPFITCVIFSITKNQMSSFQKRLSVLALLFVVASFSDKTGSIFNGFSYSTIRWHYLLIFIIAFVTPGWIETVLKQKSWRFISLLGAFLFFSAVLLLQIKYFNISSIWDKLVWIVGIASLIILYIMQYATKKRFFALLSAALVACVFAGLAFNNISQIITYRNLNYIVKTPSIAYYTHINDNKDVLSQIPQINNQLERIDLTENVMGNSPILLGYNGLSFYNSLLSGNTGNFLMRNLNVATYFECLSHYDGLDNRYMLESLFAVKYKTLPSNKFEYNTNYLPFKTVGDTTIYENPNSLGFDMWYDSAVNSQQVKNASPLQLEYDMLQTAQVDSVPESMKNAANSLRQVQNLSLNLGGITCNNMTFNNNILTANAGSSMTIPLNNPNGDLKNEVLFSFTADPTDVNTKENIKLTVNGTEIYAPYIGSTWRYPINSFSFNLNGDAKSINIKFITPCKLKISNMKVQMVNIDQNIDLFSLHKKYQMTNLKISGSDVTGNINNDTAGILAMNIPFSAGWTATLDGKPAKLIQVNTMQTGLYLTPGNHRISLSYITPGFILGIIITVIGILVCIAIGLFYRRRRHTSNDLSYFDVTEV